ncbi:hypothetical protein BDQ17DRAFT_1233797 [Cyathus striatus]|nr:hypothetical protein BDQ17DRAFT_1233797 [Cyathus striatus]
MSFQAATIILRARPYAEPAGRLLLLPLLPHNPPVKDLPCEVWSVIFTFALLDGNSNDAWRWSLSTICKAFKEAVLPLLYMSIRISQMSMLEKFDQHLHAADQKWDSIRRISYSAPGRWVQYLDLSGLAFTGQFQALQLDSILVNLFPLLPFLAHFGVNPSFILSKRALSSLGDRREAVNLRFLRGLSYVRPPSSLPDEDPFVNLMRQCPKLEYIEIVGQGLDPAEMEFNFTNLDVPSMETIKPLHLPKLHTLTLLSMHASPLMLALIYSQLPSLQKLTVTPYDDIPFPASLVSKLISTHAGTLRSLILFSPKSWPTRLHPSPDMLLETSKFLRHLSLEMPLPALVLSEAHSLQILSIPRPNSDFWRILERLFPKLPQLAVVRIRDVRWLRKGMTSMAQGAGVQGEMKEWQRRLARRRVRLVDADWNENE